MTEKKQNCIQIQTDGVFLHTERHIDTSMGLVFFFSKLGRNKTFYYILEGCFGKKMTFNVLVILWWNSNCLFTLNFKKMNMK